MMRETETNYHRVPSSFATMSKTAFQSFSLENDILQIPPQDEIYKFDSDANKEINSKAPWTKELSSCLYHIGSFTLDIAQSSLLQDM